jgi:hypothetical protein
LEIFERGVRPFLASAALALALVSLGLCSAGCGGGPKLVKAGGIVKYKSAPIPGADVVLVPSAEGQTAMGRTDDQGRFTLNTSGQPGALVGSYKVSIVAARPKRAVSPSEAVTMTSEQIAANREDLVPTKYNNPISSEWTATVSENATLNEFIFDLK